VTADRKTTRTGAIRNRKSLEQHGPARLRADALNILEAAIQAADPYRAAKQAIQRESDRLRIGPQLVDLREWEHIYVLGAGKATQSIALALEELLGERITDGVVALKRGEHSRLGRVRVITAGHPIPDRGSLRGGRALLALAQKAGRKDLVISAFTGGSSALAVLPPPGVSLADVQDLNRRLLACGATIFEINAVRKHVSRIKGGRLAQQIFPAGLVCLTVSDVVGDRLDYLTDLTVPDTSTYLDAWHTLDQYDLWEAIPGSIRAYLRKGAAIETPKSFNSSYYPVLLVPGEAALQGALGACEALGYRTETLPGALQGDSRDEAVALLRRAYQSFGEICREVPCALLASGETVVTLESGPRNWSVGSGTVSGGPNQEFALSAALDIQGQPGVVVAALDLDGSDGPTGAAGALTDGETIRRARQAGLNAQRCLREHDSFRLLAATGDLIYTGPTGTNVNDLMLVLLDGRD
jgi:glycerate 2-kinase